MYSTYNKVNFVFNIHNHVLFWFYTQTEIKCNKEIRNKKNNCPNPN